MKATAIKSKYLELTEESNALDYLEKARDFIRLTDKSVFAWKWVVIALHGALYGFAICACKGSSWDNVSYFTRKGDRKLISFDKALEYCQNPDRMRMNVFSRALVLSQPQQESIRWLKKHLRNNLEHFVPMLWWIEIHGMLQIATDVLDVVLFLALETRNVHTLSRTQVQRIRSAVYQSEQHLKQSRLHEESEILRKAGYQEQLRLDDVRDYFAGVQINDEEPPEWFTDEKKSKKSPPE